MPSPTAPLSPRIAVVSATIFGIVSAKSGIQAAIWLDRGKSPRAILAGLLAVYCGLLSAACLAQFSARISSSPYWNSRLVIKFRALVGISLLLYGALGFISTLPDAPPAEQLTSWSAIANSLFQPLWSFPVAVFMIASVIGFAILKSVVSLDDD